MVRGNGSARAETSVKAIARPNTIRIRMRRDTLDEDLSTITIPHLLLHRLGPGAILLVWLGMRSGTKAQPAWRLQVESGWEQTSRNRVLPGQCVTTESQPRRGLI